MNIHWQDIPKTIPLLIIILSLYAVKFFIALLYKKRNEIKSHDNFIIGINTIYYILLSCLLVILILLLLKVNVKEFFTSISIIAAAIAILSKDYISNAINGMILMFNNQISIGDYIQIGLQKGKIINISLLNVQLVNDEDDLVFIPNNFVLANDFINFTKGESRKTSIEFLAEIKFIESIEEIENYMNENVALKNKDVIPETFKIKTLSVKQNTVRLKAEGNLNTLDRKNERMFKRQLINAWIQFSKLKNKEL